jgi:hypothetical protein
MITFEYNMSSCFPIDNFKLRQLLMQAPTGKFFTFDPQGIYQTLLGVDPLLMF